MATHDKQIEVAQVSIFVRKAEMWDVFTEFNKKKLGQPFWVKSLHTGQCDNKNYIVDQYTSAKELSSWVEQGMVYVPISDVELQHINEKKQPQNIQSGVQQLSISN